MNELNLYFLPAFAEDYFNKFVFFLFIITETSPGQLFLHPDLPQEPEEDPVVVSRRQRLVKSASKEKKLRYFDPVIQYPTVGYLPRRKVIEAQAQKILATKKSLKSDDREIDCVHKMLM